MYRSSDRRGSDAPRRPDDAAARQADERQLPVVLVEGGQRACMYTYRYAYVYIYIYIYV